jgi:hypothetical protein
MGLMMPQKHKLRLTKSMPSLIKGQRFRRRIRHAPEAAMRQSIATSIAWHRVGAHARRRGVSIHSDKAADNLHVALGVPAHSRTAMP